MKRLFIQVASVGACETDKNGQDPSITEEIVEEMVEISDDDDMMTRSTEEGKLSIGSTRRVGMRAFFCNICLCFGQSGSQGLL